jgi:hypothetical protein
MLTPSKTFLICSLAALLVTGCAELLATSPGVTSAASQFRSDGYHHPRYGYGVRYLGGSAAQLLGTEWVLDNFTLEQGVPQSMKEGKAYTVKRTYDLDDDGVVDKTVEDEPLFDLRFEHRRLGAVIWLRTLPISTSLGERDLRVLAQNYVKEVSGAGITAVEFGPGTTVAVEQRFASRPLSESACALGVREAHRIDFEVANVDQLELSPDARWERARIVLLRPGFVHNEANLFKKGQFPVLMIAGLVSNPEDFDSVAPAFHQFLQLIAFAEWQQTLPTYPQTCTCGDSESGKHAGESEDFQGDPEID